MMSCFGGRLEVSGRHRGAARHVAACKAHVAAVALALRLHSLPARTRRPARLTMRRFAGTRLPALARAGVAPAMSLAPLSVANGRRGFAQKAETAIMGKVLCRARLLHGRLPKQRRWLRTHTHTQIRRSAFWSRLPKKTHNTCCFR